MNWGIDTMGDIEEQAQLETQIHQLTTLLEASNVLNSVLDITEVLNNILNLMVRSVQAEASTLWIVDSETNEIRAVCATGPSSEVILSIRLQIGEGIVGRAIQSMKGTLVENVADEPAWARHVDNLSGFETRSMMTVPLVIKGQALGAIQLLNKQGNLLFTKDDFALATALAAQSALALQNSQMYDELYRMYVSIIRTLASTLDARDPYTAGHSERVSRYSMQIAHRLGLSEDECNNLEIAALLHDVGKIGIPDHILLKPSGLTNEEFEIMKRHPVIGAEILAKIEPRKLMKQAIDTAHFHHERLDGSGYPNHLQAKQIDLFSRIVAVADSFDAMTTKRPYSNARSYLEALTELIRCRGTQYDERAVDALYNIMKAVDFQIGGRDRTMIEENVHESI